MVIDSSALLAIVLEEPDASIYASAILNDRIRLVSAATLQRYRLWQFGDDSQIRSLLSTS